MMSSARNLNLNSPLSENAHQGKGDKEKKEMEGKKGNMASIPCNPSCTVHNMSHVCTVPRIVREWKAEKTGRSEMGKWKVFEREVFIRKIEDQKAKKLKISMEQAMNIM